MATIKFTLDKRRPIKDGSFSLKVSLSHKQYTVLINLGIYLMPEQWDAQYQKIVQHPNKTFLNMLLQRRKTEIETSFFKHQENGDFIGKSLVDVKSIIVADVFKETTTDTSKNFATIYNKYMNSRKENTKEIYLQTMRHIQRFDAGWEEKRFEDINNDWLSSFEKYLEQTSPSKNARNIHLRNIRAVFNAAIDEEITSFYPFRRFKIQPVETAKRSLTVEELRTLFNYDCEEYQSKYLDMFKLIFMLIGINIVDLCNLKKINRGRIEYHRAKTNKLYSIKVEPEALEIINKYKGKSFLLDILDNYKNYKDYRHRLNENLQKIGTCEVYGRGGKKHYTPLFPFLTSYWARHTWATIAAELDIPNETIAAALGHEYGCKTTSIYVKFNERKIDEANRKVLDWVLYGKT